MVIKILHRIALFILLLFQRGALSGLSDTKYTFSCYGSDDMKEDFCDMITWNAARAYPSSDYSNYSPGVPLTWDEQDDLAEERYRSMTSGRTSSMCKSAVKRLVCAESFPELDKTSLHAMTVDAL